MQFSISFRLPINEIQWQSYSSKPDWELINSSIASSTASATWWMTYATWLTAVATIAAFIAAGASAYFSWKAVNTWKNQALGEHEFGRLLDAIQTLHDIEATITNFRSPFIRQGELEPKERSEKFRKDLGNLYGTFLKATVGLDQVWDKSFQDGRERLNKLIHEIALAANYVHETQGGMAQKTHYALVGLDDGDDSLSPEDYMKQSRQQLEVAKQRIEDDISSVRNFLVSKLKLYAK